MDFREICGERSKEQDTSSGKDLLKDRMVGLGLVSSLIEKELESLSYQ